jgi:hypothetical protein
MVTAWFEDDPSAELRRFEQAMLWTCYTEGTRPRITANDRDDQFSAYMARDAVFMPAECQS